MSIVLHKADVSTVSTNARSAQAAMQSQLATSPATPSVTAQQLTDWIVAVSDACDRLEALGGSIA